MIQFTSNCDRLVVAVEGELRMVDGEVVDPEGQIAVIAFHNEDADYGITRIDFQKYNQVYVT